MAEYPKNVVLMIGDGMGLSQISASLYHHNNTSIFEVFRSIGFSKTYAANNLITDSAAGATAMSCGQKTYEFAIGVNLDTLPMKNLMEESEERGLATGLVVTSSIVHATPAAFVAHEPMRTYYEEIALDFMDIELDYVVGGGKKYFERRRMDNRNLVSEWIRKGYTVKDYFGSDFPNYGRMNPKRNFVYFTADNQPVSNAAGRRYLPMATQLALPFLQEHNSEEGFFLLVEGSQIDWMGHSNQGVELMTEMRDFEAAVEKVLRFAERDGETLVIVTADHETGGLAINQGSKFKKLKIAWTSNGHTATMVPVFAYGPQAALFQGIYENTEIYHKIRQAFRWSTPEASIVPPSKASINNSQ
ncbi:MAG: alkaline phosphatase [Bacteroidota bacterium]